jgi:hypothetical protein
VSKDFLVEQFTTEFGDRKYVSRKELFAFYNLIEPGLNESTFRWRIHQLKNKDVISVISKEYLGVFQKPTFDPLIGEQEKRIISKIRNQFESLKYCVWSTNMLNEFMLHLPKGQMIILQVEKEAIDPVYGFLKSQRFHDLFIDPSEKEIVRYVFESENPIVLLPLISKSPIRKNGKYSVPTLEKLLVDVYCDKKLFSAFQGNEFVHIVNNAYDKYSIDFTKLFHYAKRRKRETEMLALFSESTEIPRFILND